MEQQNHEARIAMLEKELKLLAVAIAKGEAGKLHAIRAWRAATGALLKDAKEYIESFQQQQPRTDGYSLQAQIDGLATRVRFLEQRLLP